MIELINKKIHNIFTHVPIGDRFVSNRIKLLHFNNMEILKLTGGLNSNRQCIIEVKLISPFNYMLSTRTAKAIIDTGSYYNLIRRSIIILDHVRNENKTVNFAPVGDKIEAGELYSCNLLIPSLSTNAVIPEFAFIASEGIFEGIDIILGADFLRNFIFKYNYPKEGEFYLEFINLE
ncbi:MAG: hypothetical protein WKF97_08390 [Chitinophagaceae bacterium]